MSSPTSPSWRARTLVAGAFAALLMLVLAAPLGAATDTTTSPSPSSASSASPSTTTSTTGAGGVRATVTTPSIAVAPATGLVNGQRVTVTGRRPAQVVVQCSADGRCDDTMSVPVPPGADGTTFTVSLVVRRVMHLGTRTVDCAGAGACRVQAQVTPGTLALTDAFAYVRFAAGPTVNPGVTATPSTGLHDVERVHLSGSGFLPTASVSIAQCAADGTLCEPLDVPDVTATRDGTVTADGHVLRTLRTAGPAYDCAVRTCVVRLATADGDAATAALAFDATVPLRPPLAATVTPDAGLTDGQTVALQAVGFAPGDALVISQCAVPADVNEPPACAPLATPTVPATGVVDATITVHADVVDSFGIARPCGTARCMIDVASAHAPDDVHVPLAFGGPVPPPLPSVTLTVTPATGLVDRQIVDVSGDNLAPSPTGDLPALYECVTGVFQYACAAGGTGVVVPDATGHYTTTFRVQRVVTGADGTRYDCADAPGRCTLSLDLAHAVPLAFDASVPAAPRPAVSLGPSGPLADRSAVAVHATGLVPGAYVAVTQCRASTCDVLDATSATADGSGSLDVTLHVYRVFEDLAAGRVDCTTGCSITVDDGTGNVGIAAIAFDPVLGLAAPVPSITVRDARALVGGGDTVVTGSGFGPFTTVVLAACPAGASDPSRCDAFDHAVVDAAGTFTATTGTKAVLTTPTGPLDCRVAFATCVDAAWDGHDLFTAPVGFVAGSPTGVQDPPSTTPPTVPSTTVPAPNVDVLGEQVSRTAAGRPTVAARRAASGSSLPFTGGSPARALAVAAAMLTAGAALVATTRRRRSRRVL